MKIEDIDFSKGLTDAEVRHILLKHFMGEDYYTINCGILDSNAEFVDNIIKRYPEGSIRRIPKNKKKEKLIKIKL